MVNSVIEHRRDILTPFKGKKERKWKQNSDFNQEPLH